MARRFFYVSMGILALALSWNLGARSARAEWESIDAGCIPLVYNNIYWAQSGEAWSLNDGAFTRFPGLDLPMPTSDVKFIASAGYGWNLGIVTYSGEFWYLIYQQGWSQLQFPGCDGTSVQKDSWGGIKSRFR